MTHDASAAEFNTLPHEPRRVSGRVPRSPISRDALATGSPRTPISRNASADGSPAPKQKSPLPQTFRTNCRLPTNPTPSESFGAGGERPSAETFPHNPTRPTGRVRHASPLAAVPPPPRHRVTASPSHNASNGLRTDSGRAINTCV